MEEGERKQISAPQSQKKPRSNHAANGKTAGSVKVPSPTQQGAGEGLMEIAAKILSSKAKRKGSARDSSGKTDKHNGCDDDLPLGSEAHSLSQEYATNTESKYPVPEEKSSKWRRISSQGMMGWQSFNSDVSNQTSASSASLEQLLNDRQVDPEEMLLSLGFGGESQSVMPTLARVPLRFLHHPSRAYGIAPTGLSEEEVEVEDSTDAASTVAPLPGKSAPAAPTTGTLPQARKRSGIWTLARTLSMLRLKTNNTSRGNMSPSSNSSGTQPPSNQLVSILHPANQRYLASRGFYQKQGWPKGSFAEPEEDSLHAVKEEVESKDAALKRKMFKKTRPHRNWSICDSEENEGISGGNEWISKSADGYKSREDFAGQDDSLGRGTYFSTTTESSTDSLDTPNLETERAFENIRREYEKNRQDRSSSDDLFLPSRKKRLSSEAMSNDDNLGSEHGLDLLGPDLSNTNYFVSPTSSRQATVEKAPTICDQSPSVNLNDDGTDNCEPVDMPEEASRLDGHYQLTPHSSGQATRRVQYTDEDSRGDVRIIISSSDNREGRHWSLGRNHQEQNGKSSRLVVNCVQTASSDSGSSSATAVGSSSSTLTTDKFEQRHPSESENSAADWDSISRTNSPYGFGRRSDMVSTSCQTTETDFNIAAAANSDINVSAMSTNNRSVLFVQINESGHSSPTQDRMKGEYIGNQQSSKVQLSTIPPTISHLELMKRLQHSQNELSRMGSLQSDSSGFGDADPALEPDNVKLASLGSSLESCRTLASSTATTVISMPRTEEMATQTFDQSKPPTDTMAEPVKESSHFKENPNSTDREDHYVTMCYIPSLTSRTNQSAAVKHKPKPAGDGGPVVSNQSGAHLPWRSRSGSEPRHPAPASRRPPWLDTDQDISSHWHQLPSRFGPESGRCFVRTNPPPSSNYKHIQSHRQTGHYSTADWHPRSSRNADTSKKKTFTSQIDLFTNIHGFSSQEASFDSQSVDSNASLRRHSDEGILEGRNTAPLSIELALAKTSNSKPTNPTHFTRSSGLTSHDSSALITPTDSQTDAGFHFSLIAGNISSLPSQQVSDRPIDSYMASRSTSRQRSCDILDDDYEDRDSIMTQSHSKMSDDLDASSPLTERSSEFSVQSAPDGQSNVRTGVLESRKLTRLINQPIYFMGARRWGQFYQPSHAFKDWSLLSKRKRHEEESRLVQTAVQKYKTELTILEASLMVDCQTTYPNMTEPEKEELKELEWLWNEVKGQVLEMEHMLIARVKALHAGNEFYSLISSLGVINGMVELIKEQICQQQLTSSRAEEARDRSMDDDLFGGEISRHHSFQSSHGWFPGMGQMSTPRTTRKYQSSSTSYIPQELNMSLEQIKSSVLSQVQEEIKESTKKLEENLQEKDHEIRKLQEQLLSRSLSLTDQQPRRWTPKSPVSKTHQPHTKPRSPKTKRHASQETDV